MKKLLFIAFLLTSTAAMAQTAPGTASVPVATATSSTPAVAGKPTAAQKEEKFDDHKAKALQRVDERLSELQQKQSCIQGATTPEALKACFPDKGEHKGRKGGCDMDKPQ